MKTKESIKRVFNSIRSITGLFAAFYCVATLNGCMTTESIIVSPEPDGTYRNTKISKIVLKNGDKIECKGKLVVFKENLKDSSGTFIITERNEQFASGQGESNITAKSILVPSNDVLIVYQEYEEVDGVKTTFAVLGTIAGTAAGIFIVGFTLGVGSFANP